MPLSRRKSRRGRLFNTETLECRTLLAAPVGDLTEGNAAAWTTFASDNAAASVTNDTTHVRAGSQSLKFTTASGFDTGVRLQPGTAWNLNDVNLVEFWMYGDNNTPVGWQGNQPIVVLNSPAGSLRLEPNKQLAANHTWGIVHVPFAGDATWQRTVTGTFDQTQVTSFEIHLDTWDFAFSAYFDGVQFVNRTPQDLPPAGPAAPDGVNPDAIRSKVLMYAFDPIMENFGGQRQHQVYGWADPVVETGQIVDLFNQHSHGLLQYDVVTQVVDAHPYFVDGFQHTDASFATAWAARDFHNSQFDYLRFIAENNLVERVDSGEIDEVWIFAGPIGGMWESSMAGTGAYWINGPTQNVASERVFPIMGLNFEAGLANAMHSFGHRVEGTLSHVYNTLGPNQNWSKFTTIDKNAPGQGGVGNIHFPVNGVSDYDYANQTFVTTNADDWYNYPNFQGVTRQVNAQEWRQGGDYHLGYMKWWYDHLPHMSGRGNDFLLNNWWRYIADLNQYNTENPNLALTGGVPQVAAEAEESVYGAFQVSADAFVDGALGRVDFYVDGAFVGTDALAPFNLDLDSTDFAPGAHTLVAKAYELQNGTEGVSAPQTLWINTSSPPAITMPRTTARYRENDPPVVLGGGATLTDVDSPNLAGGTLTATLTAGGAAGDRLSFRAGQVALSGANVLIGGVAVGTWSGGSGGAPFSVLFNTAATPGRVQILLRNLTYASDSDNPAAAPRTVSVQVSDGDGGRSVLLSRQIQVTPVNDPPILGAIPTPQTYRENGAAKQLAPLATLLDPDNAAFNGGKLIVKYATGGLGSDRLTIRHQGTGPGQVGVSGATISVGGVAVATFTGGTGLQPLVISFNAAAKPLRVQAVLRNIVYQNISDNPTNFGANPSRTVQWQLTDGAGGTSSAVSQTLNLTAVNDAATVGGFSDAATYTVGTSAQILDDNAVVNDRDSANFAGGNLVLQFTNGVSTNRLAIRHQGTGAGQIGVSGGNITFGGMVIGTLNANGGVGLTALIVTFNASATPAAVQALVRNLTYRSTATQPTGPHTLKLILRDGDGGVTTVFKPLTISSAAQAVRHDQATAFARFAEWSAGL